MRTIIDIPEEQVVALAAICKKERISKAEAIRRALARMIADQEQSNARSAFGSWSGRKLDSREFVEQIRSEWSE